MRERGLALAIALAALLAAGMSAATAAPPAAVAELLRPPVASAAPRATVLFLSGDLGWRVSMARRVAGSLAEGGYVVAGLDSVGFFGTPRQAPEIARWIAEASRAPGLPQAGPLILAGQSFGADQILPALPHLPLAVRERLAGVVLVVPGATRYDHVGLGERLGLEGGEDAKRHAASLPAGLPLLCIRGAQETGSLCPLLAGLRVEQVELPGGHMLGRDAEALARVITRWLERRPGP